MSKRITLALAAVALLSNAAFAQSIFDSQRSDRTSAYVGASGGQSNFRTNCSSAFSCDKKDSAWKVYAGGSSNDILGFEVGYTDFGKIRASGGETNAWAVPVSLTAGVPIGTRFNAFGKFGGLYGRTDVRASVDSLTERGKKSGWGWTYGAGASFAVTPAIAIRADWDRYKLDFAGGRKDVDMLSAGVQFRY